GTFGTTVSRPPLASRYKRPKLNALSTHPRRNRAPRCAIALRSAMPLGLIGTQVGMTQVYDADGQAAPVTVLQLGPCPVLQVRTTERDGYAAVQLGFKDKPRKNASRAERGHVSNALESKRRAKRQGQDIPKKADVEPQRVIREFKLDGAAP